LITPVKSGERSSPARMIACVCALVRVIQHGTWRGCIARVPMNENTGVGSSPGCVSSPLKSIVRPSRRGGVPVFNRPTGSDSSRSFAPSVSPADRPRARLVVLEPDVDEPERNVPVVSTTASASKRCRSA
jgi:hypothetical protein